MKTSLNFQIVDIIIRNYSLIVLSIFFFKLCNVFIKVSLHTHVTYADNNDVDKKIKRKTPCVHL